MENVAQAPPRPGRWWAATLACLLLASAALHLGGIERNLPDARDVDEDALLRPAIRIASSGNLNPGWFGYPGSTVIYPLAVLLHVQQAALHGGRWLEPNRRIRFAFFGGDFAPYVRTGRLLSSAYGVASVALVALVGLVAFEPRSALVAAALTAFSPLAIEYAQPLRSDSAATFFGLLFLAAVLKLVARPSLRWHLLAGAALGLAIASRYMMATGAAVLLAAQEHLTRRDGPSGARGLAMIAGWLAVPAAFLLVTPYFVLDPSAAIGGVIQAATRQRAHTGIDQLGFIGNLRFYLGTALPDALGWAPYAIALATIALAAWRRSVAPVLLAVYAAAYVVGVSMLGIHWQRWIIPVLPVLALLAARGLVAAIDAASARFTGGRRRAATVALIAVTLALVVPATREAIRRTRLHATPSTEIDALEWVLANVPARSAIAHEWYTAPLNVAKRARAKRYRLLSPDSLARRPLHFYRSRGFEYLLVSSNMYNRFFRKPARHRKEVGFYRRLRRVGVVLHEVRGSPTKRGPTITIYRLPAAAGARAAEPEARGKTPPGEPGRARRTAPPPP